MIVDMLYPALVFFWCSARIYTACLLTVFPTYLSVLHDAAIIAQDFMDTLYTRCTA